MTVGEGVFSPTFQVLNQVGCPANTLFWFLVLSGPDWLQPPGKDPSSFPDDLTAAHGDPRAHGALVLSSKEPIQPLPDCHAVLLGVTCRSHLCSVSVYLLLRLSILSLVAKCHKIVGFQTPTCSRRLGFREHEANAQ